MKKIIKHFRRWNIWRKNNLNSKLHKFLVLIGFIKSPTLGCIITPEEHREILEAIRRGYKEGMELAKEHTSIV